MSLTAGPIAKLIKHLTMVQPNHPSKVPLYILGYDKYILVECQSDKSPDFGLQEDHDSYHLPKKKGIKTNSSQVRGYLKK